MATQLTGAVYDRGYRPYDGPRGGRRAAIRALFLASVRRALGLRRAWRQKFFPWTLLAITSVPAIVDVGRAYVTRGSTFDEFQIITYRDYVGVSTALLLFVGLTAPDVICPDRRNRVLPLIFARPLIGRDYVFAKVGAIGAIVFAFAFLPQVLLFVGQMLVSDDGALRYVRDNAEVIWQVPVSVAILAAYYAAISVAIASLTTRRIVAGASLLGVLLITSSVSAIVAGGEDVDGSYAGLINILALPLHLRDLVFLGNIDPTSPLEGVPQGGLLAVLVYVGVLLASIGVLLERYAWVER
jgi:ABC-2 type transport system permease protein